MEEKMNRNDILKLKQLVNEEIERRTKINELLNSDLVQEFIKLNNIRLRHLDEKDLKDIIKNVFKDYKINNQ